MNHFEEYRTISRLYSLAFFNFETKWEKCLSKWGRGNILLSDWAVDGSCKLYLLMEKIDISITTGTFVVYCGGFNSKKERKEKGEEGFKEENFVAYTLRHWKKVNIKVFPSANERQSNSSNFIASGNTLYELKNCYTYLPHRHN